jgi:hypothetical protein
MMQPVSLNVGLFAQVPQVCQKQFNEEISFFWVSHPED